MNRDEPVRRLMPRRRQPEAGGVPASPSPAGVPRPIKEAVARLRPLFEQLRHPLLFRKMNGVLNAMEMGVEEGFCSPPALRHLAAALLATGELYKVDLEQSGLAAAVEALQRAVDATP